MVPVQPFLSNLLNRKNTVTGVHLPPDANTLLATMERLLDEAGKINAVVAGKHDVAQWLDLDAARAHCRAGASAWDWASTHGGEDPEVVLACAGGIPTVESLAAADLLRRDLPDARIRFVNVVDLCTLAPPDRHPHGMPDEEFHALFGGTTPVVFDFHGSPSAVHQLLHGRPHPGRFHVRGYIEEGTTTTPYDLLALNGTTRHDIAATVLEHLPAHAGSSRRLAARYVDHHDRRLRELRSTGVDPAEITEWKWRP